VVELVVVGVGSRDIREEVGSVSVDTTLVVGRMFRIKGKSRF
jgi:hypothetical protein